MKNSRGCKGNWFHWRRQQKKWNGKLRPARFLPTSELTASRCKFPKCNSRQNKHGFRSNTFALKPAAAKRTTPGALAALARQAGAGFKTPPAMVIPFGVMETALRAMPELEADYKKQLVQINGLPSAEFTATTERLRELIQRLTVPAEIAAGVATQFGRAERLMVRSSANCEDLEELAGAGLYDSIANVAAAEVAAAVRAVWASLWTNRAASSRKQAGIVHAQAHMAVLIQQMLTPDYSFVLHTVNPVSRNPREVYAEIAVGLGETLVSAGERGNPYRLVCDKISGATTTLALANFSHALRPDAAGGVRREIVDYSQVELSRDDNVPEAVRKTTGCRRAFR